MASEDEGFFGCHHPVPAAASISLALGSLLSSSFVILAKIKNKNNKECDQIVQEAAAAGSVPSPKNKSHHSPMAGMMASTSSKLQVVQLHTPVITPITVLKKTSSNYVSAVPQYGARLRRISVGWVGNSEGLGMTTSRDSLAVLPDCIGVEEALVCMCKAMWRHHPTRSRCFSMSRGHQEPLAIAETEDIANPNLELMESSYSEDRQRSVAVFWDLDNKPPKAVPPYKAALRLRGLASEFGLVVDMVAYANRHAFLYVPQWIREERQERKKLDELERKGVVKVEQPYRCNFCGRTCKTHLALKKHFKQLHERERNKRLNHLNHLKGNKRLKYKEKLAEKEDRYKEVARNILVPKVGYGLAAELRRAGVYVRTVEDKPQAADEALMKHMSLYIDRGLETLILVSDDSDFINILRLANFKNLQTIVVGDTMTLSRHAQISFSWEEVASGRAQWAAAEAHVEWSNKDSLLREIKDDSDLQSQASSDFTPLRPNATVSAFSEEEPLDWDGEDESDEFWDEEDSDDDYDDIYADSASADYSQQGRSADVEVRRVSETDFSDSSTGSSLGGPLGSCDIKMA